MTPWATRKDDATGDFYVDPEITGGVRRDAGTNEIFVDPALTSGVFRVDVDGTMWMRHNVGGEPHQAKVAVATWASKTSQKNVRANVAIKTSLVKTSQKYAYAGVAVLPGAPTMLHIYSISVSGNVNVTALSPTKIAYRSPAIARVVVTSNVRGFPRRYRRIDLGFYLAGRQGDLAPRPRLYLSNIYGEEVELLRTVRNASISLSNAREHLFEMTFGMRATDRFNPLADFIKPVIEYWNPVEQTYERWPLGLYRVLMPNEDIAEASRFWNFTAASYESVIAGDMFDQGYAVLPGTKILAKVREILTTRFSIPASMLDFPPDNEDLPVNGYRIFDIREDVDGCYVLNVINQILAMGGFTQLRHEASGKFKTTRITDPRSRAPDFSYGYYGDNIIDSVQTPTIERDHAEFGNIVLVTSSDTLLPPIVARAENHNPNSPTSIENMNNRRKVQHIPLPELVNATAAQAIADAELAKRAGLNEKMTFTTPVDPRRAASNEVAEIFLPDTQDEEFWAVWGNWIYEGWAFDADPLADTMEHTVTRLEDI